jgi:hypothetical protein
MREKAFAAIKMFDSKPPSTWSNSAWLGMYLARWEQRFKRTLALPLTETRRLRSTLAGFVRRVGPDEARNAIDAVFKQPWATDPIGLLHQDRYQRYVVPLLEKRRVQRGGEQAEWTGPRGENDARIMSPREFFGDESPEVPNDARVMSAREFFGPTDEGRTVRSA